MHKLKLYSTAFVIGMAVVPKSIYFVSDKYMRGYNTASSYISDTTEKALSKIGLTTIKPEEDLSFYISKYSTEYNLNPKLVSALVRQESSENADALSLKGAIGYFQIMPENVKRCGLSKKSELWDTAKNAKCGCQILSEELLTNKGDLEKALYSYNGGSLAYSRKYPESVKYAASILKAFAQASM